MVYDDFMTRKKFLLHFQKLDLLFLNDSRVEMLIF